MDPAKAGRPSVSRARHAAAAREPAPSAGALGVMVTAVAMVLGGGLSLLVLFGLQYFSIGIFVSPSSTVDLQQASTFAAGLPAGAYLGARLTSSGPEDSARATWAALFVEAVVMVSGGWWNLEHVLAVPVMLLGSVLGVVAARKGAAAGAPPYARR